MRGWAAFVIGSQATATQCGWLIGRCGAFLKVLASRLRTFMVYLLVALVFGLSIDHNRQ